MGRRGSEHWDDGRQGGPAVDFFDVKADIEALLALGCDDSAIDYVESEHPSLRPGRTARLEQNGRLIGWLGELHPRLSRALGLAPAPVVFELDASEALAAGIPQYAPVSKFPAVRRDLAVIVVEEVTAAALTRVVRDAAGELLHDVIVFDVYRGAGIENGLKSVALGLILQETSRTLTELEIDGVISAVINSLSSELNASIRE